MRMSGIGSTRLRLVVPWWMEAVAQLVLVRIDSPDVCDTTELQLDAKTRSMSMNKVVDSTANQQDAEPTNSRYRWIKSHH